MTQSHDSLHRRACFTQSRVAGFATKGMRELYKTQFDLWLFCRIVFILTGSFLVSWIAQHSNSDWPLTHFDPLLLQFLIRIYWCSGIWGKMKLRGLDCGSDKENKELLSFEQHKDLYRQSNFMGISAFSRCAFYSRREWRQRLWK